MKLYDYLIVVLILFNIIVSLYIGIASGGENYICDTGAGCDIVKNSPYASIFGIKLAWVGLVSFSFLLFSYFFLKDKNYWIFFLFTTFGFISSIYFIYLQIFVIKALCSNCLMIDAVAIILFLLSAGDIHSRINSKKEKM